MNKKDRLVAVYIDSENVATWITKYSNEFFSWLNKLCDSTGKTMIKKLFGTYSPRWYYAYKVAADSGYYIELIPNSNHKNGVDFYITIDIMKIIQKNDNLTDIILATGDADFYPLIKEIINNGINVIIIGDFRNSSRKLKEIATKFIEINPLIIKQLVKI